MSSAVSFDPIDFCTTVPLMMWRKKSNASVYVVWIDEGRLKFRMPFDPAATWWLISSEGAIVARPFRRIIEVLL